MPVDETLSEAKIRDVKDRPILRAAINADADILLTGDKDFLESGLEKPKAMTPTEFLSTTDFVIVNYFIYIIRFQLQPPVQGSLDIKSILLIRLQQHEQPSAGNTVAGFGGRIYGMQEMLLRFSHNSNTRRVLPSGCFLLNASTSILLILSAPQESEASRRDAQPVPEGTDPGVWGSPQQAEIRLCQTKALLAKVIRNCKFMISIFFSIILNAEFTQ